MLESNYRVRLHKELYEFKVKEVEKQQTLFGSGINDFTLPPNSRDGTSNIALLVY